MIFSSQFDVFRRFTPGVSLCDVLPSILVTVSELFCRWDCRLNWCRGRELRSFLVVRGLAATQDMGAITVFRFSWPSALLSPRPCPLTYESVDQSGVHYFHRF